MTRHVQPRRLLRVRGKRVTLSALRAPCASLAALLLSDLDEQLSMSDGGLDVSGDPLSRALDDTDKVRGDGALAAACLCGP